MAKNWAILIGINQYDSLENLKCAKNDAEAMHDWLKKEEGFDRLFLFTEDSPPIPTNPPIPTEPTFGHLDTFFDVQFEQCLLTPADNLWFFFSGHGMRAADGDYLMLSDSNPRRVIQTAIAVNYVTERLRNWGTGNVVMFLDACRNEGSSKGDVIKTKDYQGIITFYSCRAKERSYEIEKLQQGAFTYVLLEALQQGKNECFTVEKLERYLMEKVPCLNNKYNKSSQKPLASVQPTGRSSLILFGSPGEEDVNKLKLAAYRAESENYSELVKKLWIQVNIATKGRDANALSALTKIVLTDGEKELLKSIQFANETSEEQLRNYISQLKLAAYQAKSELNLELARELWIKVNIFAKGQDLEALTELKKIVTNGSTDIPPSPLQTKPDEVDLFYTKLRDLLAAGKWKEADQETARVILKAAGREEEGWLRSKDVEQFPCSALCTIDQLWKQYSKGRFGFSVQRQIWLDVGGQPGQFKSGIFYKFGDRVGWRVNNEWLETHNKFTFNMNAPKGHLPSLAFPGEKKQVDFGLWKDSFESFVTRWGTCLSGQESV